MIEYLYNAIRASANEDIVITAKISTPTGEPVTSGTHIGIYNDKDERLVMVNGEETDGVWEYQIPGALTADLKGKYWYCICCNNTHKSYCFKQPIYFI